MLEGVRVDSWASRRRLSTRCTRGTRLPATSLRPQVHPDPGTRICHEQPVLHKQEVGQHIHGEALPGHRGHHEHVGAPGCRGNEVALEADAARVQRTLLMAAVSAGVGGLLQRTACKMTPGCMQRPGGHMALQR